MKRFKIIWLLLTNKQFTYQLNDVIVYALMVYSKARGTNSHTVLEFDDDWRSIIFDKYNLRIIEEQIEKYRIPNEFKLRGSDLK